MSTKAIRALLEDAGNRDDTNRHALIQKALAEVEAIEKAAREWKDDALGFEAMSTLTRIAEESWGMTS